MLKNRIKNLFDNKLIGLGVLDKLLCDIYDPSNGMVYGGLSCYNNPDIAERCRIKNAPKVIYAVTATSDFNSRIALGLREAFKQGRIHLLKSDDDFEEYASTLVGYDKLSIEEKTLFKLPYINTSLLIDELVSLQYETRGGVVKVKERSGRERKDRFSSLAYNIEVAKELEEEYRKSLERQNFSDYMFQFRKPSVHR